MGRKHARVQGTWLCLSHKRTMYMARDRPCPRVRTRPFRRATAVDTFRKHARVHDRRVCTRHLHGGVYGPYMDVVMYAMVICTVPLQRLRDSVTLISTFVLYYYINGPCTTGTWAVYMPCLRPVPVFTDTGRNGVDGPWMRCT